MASPQLEKGHIKIANDLYDAILAWRFSSYECSVLLFILRKTYGWNKKDDWISLSQFSKATKIRESHVSRALRLLLDQNVITKGGTRFQPRFGIQKDYSKWVDLPIGVRRHDLPIGVRARTNRGNSTPISGGTQKTLITTKDTVTKNTMAFPKKTKTNSGVTDKHREDAYTVIEAFKDVNIHWHILHESQKQYDATFRMLKLHGTEKLLAKVKSLKEKNKLEFFPTVYTPVQLEEKWQSLEDAETRKEKKKASKHEPKLKAPEGKYSKL